MQLNLEKAYKNFFREQKKGNKNQGFPKYKKNTYGQSYTTNNQKGTIIGTSNGKFFVSIFTEVYIQPKAKVQKKVAVDLGVKPYASLPEETVILNPKFLAQSDANIKKLQRDLSRKVKGSSNDYKNKQKLAIAQKKVANQRLEYLHKVSSQLIDENQVINIETLSVENMLKSHP